MNSVHPLLNRLSSLAASLQSRPDALALLALGSVGRETERIDAWSDLDFFVIVRPGAKAAYVRELDWLAAAHPIAWAFQNTADGYKALMADGVLCEFAVFEPRELPGIPFAPGRWIWRREDEVPEHWAAPVPALPQVQSTDWRVGEALSNLLVGLQRYLRGERVAAMRMVQVYAMDRVMELIDTAEPHAPGVSRDPFTADRRFERRHPARASDVQRWAPGIDRTPEAALALLDELARHQPLPEAMLVRIRALAAQCLAPR
ncbi:hypothetical protein IP84_01560 [beta proteobacterium AAP99]|nr:hypothetical protein IP84_01560 [beta proteobacterium AAP99]